jgi:hypothetical protein
MNLSRMYISPLPHPTDSKKEDKEKQHFVLDGFPIAKGMIDGHCHLPDCHIIHIQVQLMVSFTHQTNRKMDPQEQPDVPMHLRLKGYHVTEQIAGRRRAKRGGMVREKQVLGQSQSSRSLAPPPVQAPTVNEKEKEKEEVEEEKIEALCDRLLPFIRATIRESIGVHPPLHPPPQTKPRVQPFFVKNPFEFVSVQVPEATERYIWLGEAPELPNYGTLLTVLFNRRIDTLTIGEGFLYALQEGCRLSIVLSDLSVKRWSFSKGIRQIGFSVHTMRPNDVVHITRELPQQTTPGTVLLIDSVGREFRFSSPETSYFD